MLDSITWQTLNPDSPLPPHLDPEAAARWLRKVITDHSRLCGEINYIFCSDEELLDINRRFLSHDYYTDIITFDYSRGRLVSGDIYISLDTVASNAALFNQPPVRELHRVIVHGVLHLCGINDKGPGERAIMESHENSALSALHV